MTSRSSPRHERANHPVGGGRDIDGLSKFRESTAGEFDPPPMLSPIQLPRAAEEVADRLMTAVAIGDYLPGDRLPPERELAATFGIGRAAIHDALGRLEAMGIVDIRRGRLGGAYVMASWGESSAHAIRQTLVPRWEEFEQLLDLRALVEELVGRTAAERRTMAQVNKITTALRAFRAAKSPHEEQLADSKFHAAVLAATGNPKLFALSRSLLAASTLSFPYEPWGTGQKSERTEFHKALDGHEAMCRAVTDGDVEMAGKLSRTHFTITIDTIRAVLARAQDPPSD